MKFFDQNPSLLDLSLKNSINFKTNIDMYTKIYLPTEQGYQQYLKDMDEKDRQRKFNEQNLSPEAYFTSFGCSPSEFPDDYDINGKLKKDSTLWEFLPPKEFVPEKRDSKSEFYSKQINNIHKGIHCPVWKIFFYLLYQNKAVYSSAGFGGSGEPLNHKGTQLCYGVSWKENNMDYRIALLGEDLVLAKRKTKVSRDETSSFKEALCSEVNIELDKIVPLRMADFIYFEDQQLNEQVMIKTLEEVQKKIGVQDEILYDCPKSSLSPNISRNEN